MHIFGLDPNGWRREVLRDDSGDNGDRSEQPDGVVNQPTNLEEALKHCSVIALTKNNGDYGARVLFRERLHHYVFEVTGIVLDLSNASPEPGRSFDKNSVADYWREDFEGGKSMGRAAECVGRIITEIDRLYFS